MDNVPGSFDVLDRAVWTVAGAGARALRIAAVRTAELDHEALDDAVEVQTVIEAGLGQLDEVARRDRHLVRKQFDLQVTERSGESRSRVRHGGGSY